MRFLIALCILLIVTSSCMSIIQKFPEKLLGLKLIPQNITDIEVVSFPSKHFALAANIGKLDTTFITGIISDSNIIDSNKRSRFVNFILQPMNAIFFDSTQKMFAAYAICDADIKKIHFTWEDYLKRSALKSNIDVVNNAKFNDFRKHFIILKSHPIDTNQRNVILVWSKMASRQNKYFLKEFQAYLKDKHYNIYVMNLDYALQGVELNGK